MARILVVDDSLFSRMSLKKILTADGHEVIGESANGVDACAKYIDLKPDLVTMDITMPEMDGLEALKNIRGVNPEAQIIMISALGQETKILEALNRGAKDYITKPYESGQVISAVNEIFNQID